MKTKLMYTLLVVALSALTAGSSLAAVNGACVNCHTMHDSQGGSAVATDGPNAMLLLSGTCSGCHADANVTNSLTGLTDGNAPQVDGQYNTAALAGGSFDFTEALKIHNTEELDSGAALAPWGLNAADAGVPRAAATGWGTTQLTCAGTYGCHGDGAVADKFTSIKGGHHNDGGATASGYRFLNGIAGIEDDDWQFETAIDHNVYKGAARTSGTAVTDTISSLCAQCHGKFHAYDLDGTDSTIGIRSASGAWVRHPTDVVIPGGSTEYNSATVYTEQVPFGIVTPTDNTSWAATPGTDTVICVSCHRAHGSQFDYLLRWDYSTMTAGGGNDGGCFTCHTNKN